MTGPSLESRQWEIVGTLLGVSEQPLSDLDAVRLVRKRFQLAERPLIQIGVRHK